MIPVLMTQTQPAAGDDPRARGDKPAATGEFASLLDSLSELTGEGMERPRTMASQEGRVGSQKAQPSGPPHTPHDKASDGRDGREAPAADTHASPDATPKSHGHDILSRLAAFIRKEPAPHPSEQVPSSQEPSARSDEAGEKDVALAAPSRGPAPIVRRPAGPAGAEGKPGIGSLLDASTAPLEAVAEAAQAPSREQADVARADRPLVMDKDDGAGAEVASLVSMPPGAFSTIPADEMPTGSDDGDRPPTAASPVSRAAGEPADEPVAAPAMRIVLRETHFAPVVLGNPRPTEVPAPIFSLEPASPPETPAQDENHPRQAAIARPQPLLQDDRTEPQPRMEGQVQRREEMEAASLTLRDTAADEPAPVATAANAAAAPSPGSIAAPPALGSPPASGLVSGSPAEQVSTAIRHAGTSPLANGLPTGPSGGPVRILEIQLNPLELGVVTVRLRNGRDGLEIRVHAARAETAQLLAQDRTALLASLSDQGHVPADLTITSFGATAGLTGHDARTPTNPPWRAPDEDAGRRQPDSGTRRDDRQNPQNQDPRNRDTGERAAD